MVGLGQSNQKEFNKERGRT